MLVAVAIGLGRCSVIVSGGALNSTHSLTRCCFAQCCPRFVATDINNFTGTKTVDEGMI